MLRQISSFGLMVCGLAVAGCRPSASSVPEAEVRQAVQDLLAGQVAAWNQGDIDGFMRGYWASDSLRFASAGNVSYGWRALRERYRTGYPDRAAMGRLAFSELDVQVVASDAALAFGKWRLERADDSPWGYFTLLLRRLDVGWRIVHDHTSSAR